MTRLFKTVGIIFAITSVAYAANVDGSPSFPQIPDALWERHVGAIDLYIALTTTGDKGGEKQFIKIFLRNTSNTPKDIIIGPGASSGDGGFLVFIKDNANSRHLLHDYDPFHGKGTPQQEMLFHSGSARWDEIAPGETTSRSIELTPEEFAQVKTHSIQIKFHVVDKGTGKGYDVESLPKAPTEIAAPVSK